MSGKMINFVSSIHPKYKIIMKILPTLVFTLLISAPFLSSVAQPSQPSRYAHPIRHDVPRDSIVLSDPAVIADPETDTYYMTGTSGVLWKSKDLDRWDGPYIVAQPDTTSWMGTDPQIWAAEIHKYNDKYYYFATFTNDGIIIETNQEGQIPRRASHILVADSPDGPYRPVSSADYLPADRPTLDGTLWVEEGHPYMIFCGEWLHNQNGTMEAILFSDDMASSVGEPFLLFRASDSPWSRERRSNGEISFNRVTDGPWLFRTDTGKLGMLWTSWILGDYTMGVAYSESGTLKGPWIQEPEPITPPNHGHGMIFTDLNGRHILSAHSHSEVNGRYIRRPVFWEVDISGDKLKIVKKLTD